MLPPDSSLLRTCRISGKKFIIHPCEVDLLRRISEVNPAIRAEVPLPTLHPVECVRQMATYGSLMNLYRGKSALSGKAQLTRYNPAYKYLICTQDEYWSDQVDNSQFGREYDFSRPFFEQWNELMHAVYLLPLTNTNNENSEYVNGGQDMKNCYLCFACSQAQDCLYCFTHYHGNDNIECANANKCQFCYHCSDVENCYESQNCVECETCSNCIGCIDCTGCSFCTGCVGIEHRQYCFFNEKLSPEQYQERVRDLNLGSYAARHSFLERLAAFLASSGHVPNRLINVENCTGSYIRRGQNLVYCFNSRNCKDCGYQVAALDSTDCWKGYAINCEFNYNSINYNAYNCHYSYGIFRSESCWYGYVLGNSCAHCFGCSALKQKSYCILNKQYSKGEYMDLVPRIVAHMRQTGEWGQYFPAKLAPHSYEDSWVNDYLTEIPHEEVLRRGYHSDPPLVQPAPPNAIQGADLPDHIDDAIPAMLLSQPIACATTGAAFNIQEREIAFYQRFKIPLPRTHWRERLVKLIRRRDRMDEHADACS